MAPPSASGEEDSSSPSPSSFREGICCFFSWVFCCAFRRRARRDCERERLPGVSEISESVVSLVGAFFLGGSVEDIMVVGVRLGGVAWMVQCSGRECAGV